MRMNDAGTPAFVSAPCIVSPSTIGTTVSASPCTMSEGASPGETKRMGEYCAASASVNLVAGNARLFCHRERSVGGKYATTAATRLGSLSTASEGRRIPGVRRRAEQQRELPAGAAAEHANAVGGRHRIRARADG
jgi:hypothetical protein